MRYTKEKIQQILAEKLPPSACVPEHTDKGHFYRVKDKLYPSVTASLQMFKDESLMNWKMNVACQYIMEHADRAKTLDGLASVVVEAKRAPGDIFEDAGDIGSRIHLYRQRIFDAMMKGFSIPNFSAVIPADEYDVRAVSAMRALEKFVKDYNYVPIATEVCVYSVRYGIAGTLDDLGMIGGEMGDFVLLDLKSSNSIHKVAYCYQVALYYICLKEITGLRPRKLFILRVSKEDGTYELKEIRPIGSATRYARYVLKLNQGNERMKEMFKKEIITL